MRYLAAVVVLFCFSLPALAQNDARERAAKYQKLQQESVVLFSEEKWAEAAAKCEEILKIAPKDAITQYNLACAMSRLNKPEAAIDWLKKSVENGYNEPDHMLLDQDLTALHNHEAWKGIVEQAKKNEEAGGPYDKGVDIPDVKTVEGAPEGGLRYRLRMAKEPDAKNPAKLIIWLHPSGGSMNERVEKLSPEFIQRGYALLVPTQKEWRGWSDEDVKKLIDKTLPEVAKVEGISTEKPVLMGFSAGGQVALNLWRHKPEQFGGLIFSAAYPVRMDEDRVQLMELPEDKESAKATPIYAVVGSADRGADLWGRVQNKWLDAGVPLKVETVPNRRHEWLLTGKTLDRAYEWLKDVKDGKKPTDSATTRPKRQVAI